MTDTVTLVLSEAGECGFYPPTFGGWLISGFGYRVGPKFHYTAGRRSHGRRGRHASHFNKHFVGYGSQYHQGVDITLHVGDNVYAAFDGIIRISQYNLGGYGQCIVIRHYNGLETLYGHLSMRSVQIGQVVKAGELIGLGGSTGHSTGPHLHFETRYKGQPIDPTTLIDFTIKTADGFHLKSDSVTLTRENFSPYGSRLSRFASTGKQHSPRRFYAYTKAVGTSRIAQYKIKKGDSISTIAARHHTSISKVLAMNGLSKSSKLRLGQSIRIR